MLLELAQWLAKDIRAFNVFSYITLRAVLSTIAKGTSPGFPTAIPSAIVAIEASASGRPAASEGG